MAGKDTWTAVFLADNLDATVVGSVTQMFVDLIGWPRIYLYESMRVMLDPVSINIRTVMPLRDPFKE